MNHVRFEPPLRAHIQPVQRERLDLSLERVRGLADGAQVFRRGHHVEPRGDVVPGRDAEASVATLPASAEFKFRHRDDARFPQPRLSLNASKDVGLPIIRRTAADEKIHSPFRVHEQAVIAEQPLPFEPESRADAVEIHVRINRRRPQDRIGRSELLFDASVLHAHQIIDRVIIAAPKDGFVVEVNGLQIEVVHRLRGQAIRRDVDRAGMHRLGSQKRTAARQADAVAGGRLIPGVIRREAGTRVDRPSPADAEARVVSKGRDRLRTHGNRSGKRAIHRGRVGHVGTARPQIKKLTPHSMTVFPEFPTPDAALRITRVRLIQNRRVRILDSSQRLPIQFFVRGNAVESKGRLRLIRTRSRQSCHSSVGTRTTRLPRPQWTLSQRDLLSQQTTDSGNRPEFKIFPHDGRPPANETGTQSIAMIETSASSRRNLRVRQSAGTR